MLLIPANVRQAINGSLKLSNAKVLVDKTLEKQIFIRMGIANAYKDIIGSIFIMVVTEIVMRWKMLNQLLMVSLLNANVIQSIYGSNRSVFQHVMAYLMMVMTHKTIGVLANRIRFGFLIGDNAW